MIGFLSGTVFEISGPQMIIDVGGVGYDVLATRALIQRCEIEAIVRCPIFTDVQEHGIRLFGFDDRAEKQVFLLLNRVSGLGPKSALDIISQVDKRELLRSIGRGDVQSLTRVRGIGKKKAERIVVELKDMVATLSFDQPVRLTDSIVVESNQSKPVENDARDAISALEVLGFSRREAEKAVEQAVSQGIATGGAEDTGILVREALRYV